MDYSKPFAERERALEEAFFRKESERLIAAMRERKSRTERFEALSTVLDMRDPAIIDPLLDAGLLEENVTALTMAPLVAVAWADHTLDNEERKTILDVEHELGIDPESDAGKLLSVWLDHRPHPKLLDAWAAYATELCRRLTPADRERLREDVVHWSRKIAHTLEKTFLRTGGPSRAERETLDRIEAAFAFDGEKPAKTGAKGSALDDVLRSMS